MTLIVEDGTGLPDANGYVSVAYADAYHAARGNAVWGPLDNAVKEAAIINATSFVDGANYGRWRGTKASSEQALAWPRAGARDERGAAYEGLPGELEEATAEYALRQSQSPLDPDPSYDDSGRVVTGSTDRVEGAVTESRTYAEGGQTVTRRRYPAADRLLRPLVSGGGMVVRV